MCNKQHANWNHDSILVFYNTYNKYPGKWKEIRTYVLSAYCVNGKAYVPFLFDFDIVNFPFLDGDVPRRASYGVYISQLIRFARVCNHVTDFNARNKCLTAKLLQQGYRYHKLRKTFSKFYRRHYELISKYNVGLKTLLSEGLSEPEFYGDLVYKLKKLKGINDFSLQFGKIISRYRRIGYNLNVMRQSACLVFNPIMVDNYAAFFNCTPVGRASDSMMAPT